MDIRSNKELFLENLELDNDQKRAVELAIDCIIENETNEELPIVITGMHSYTLNPVLNSVQVFFEQTYPGCNKELFKPRMLIIFSSSTEGACVELIKQLRCDTGLLYYADSYNFFSALPSNLFHVISLEKGNVTRGKNKKMQSPEIEYKTYNSSTLNDELFTNFHHSNSPNTASTGQKFQLEAASKIVRPIPAPQGAKFDEEITIDSPIWQKEACVALRRYQAKECRDGMGWGTDDDGWQNIIAYPILDEIQSLDGSATRECIVGLVTIDTSISTHPYLSTVWIHPFYRRQGRMAKLWKQLTDKYGTLGVEKPNSDMQSFLNKVNNRP